MVYYSVREISEMFDFKVRTIRSWISRGRLKAKKDKKGRRWKISKKNLEKFVYDNEN